MSSNILIILSLIFLTLGILFLFLTYRGVKKRTFLKVIKNLVLTLLMFSLSTLFASINISINGYKALTKEELAASVRIEPVSDQLFKAYFTLPDGSEKNFTLAGDQVYVDAHILKWEPIGNILGLHTSYELDRVSGRYSDLNDERNKLHTHFSLSENSLFNMFDLRKNYTFLSPLVDAEYGSASFINSDSPVEFNIMVSTSGLLIRKLDK